MIYSPFSQILNSIPVPTRCDLHITKRLILPIVVGIIFFVTALAWNSSINATIDFYTAERDFLIPTQRELIADWVYTISITAFLVLFVYWNRNTLKKSVLHLEPHESPGLEVGPDVAPIAPAPVIPNMPTPGA